MIVTSHRELRNRRQKNVANGQISGTNHQGFMKLQLRQSQTRYVYRERGGQISGTNHQGFMKFQLQQSQTRYAYRERGDKYQRPATRVLWNSNYGSHRPGMFIGKGGGDKYQGPATRVLWNSSYSSHRTGMLIWKGGTNIRDQPPGFYEISATAVTDQVCL